jgi:hypothetical protein
LRDELLLGVAEPSLEGVIVLAVCERRSAITIPPDPPAAVTLLHLIDATVHSA